MKKNNLDILLDLYNKPKKQIDQPMNALLCKNHFKKIATVEGITFCDTCGQETEYQEPTLLGDFQLYCTNNLHQKKIS